MFTISRSPLAGGALTLALVAMTATASTAATTTHLPLLTRTNAATSINAGCNVAASIREAEEADVPLLAQLQGKTGMTTLVVDLDAAGRLTAARVGDSSGFGPLDEAALRSARMSRFAPEIRNCTPIGGTYAMEVDFRAAPAR